jgi:uncharacterized caspase-like protein
MHWLEENIEPGDVAMIFFSGHGVNDRYGELSLLLSDADTSSEARLRRTTVDYGLLFRPALKELANGRRAKAVVVFLDACYAGNTRALPPDTSRVVADLAAEENGIIVFASSGPSQLSEEYPTGENGAFTEALLEAFAGKANYDSDNSLRFSELQRYVSTRVRELTQGRRQPSIDIPERRLADPPLLFMR